MQNYGTLSLTVTSPVQVVMEPVTLADVRDALHMTSSDATDQDTLIQALIAAARELAESHQKKCLAPRQFDYVMDLIPVEIRLPMGPVVSVDLFTYKDSGGTVTTMVANTDYIVDLTRGIITPPYGDSWPSFTAWPSSAVTVRFTAGKAADVTAATKQAIKAMVVCWFQGGDDEKVTRLFNILCGDGANEVFA